MIRRVMRPLMDPNPDEDDEPSFEDALNGELNEPERPPTAECPFADVLHVLGKQFDHLSTMEARSRFLSNSRESLGMRSMSRYNWKEAGQLLVLFTKLLHIFGWVDGDIADRVKAAVTSSGDESKNLTLFRTIATIPWGIVRQRCTEIARIEDTLNKKLYGMAAVKQEILDEIVLHAHASGSPVMNPFLFHGPPGTGKTAMGVAVADALGLPFFKIALGGNVDMINLRGAHFAWSSSTISFFTRTLIAARCQNPVCMLDELDKAGGERTVLTLSIV